ncbi:MAG TPA: hypothetical protein VIA62_19595 [Thermoanaerobaculia bacterium]|jgi:hypothetical protein|nr:hypothetical protein [Thermoanaerobaculia bacterium]
MLRQTLTLSLLLALLCACHKTPQQATEAPTIAPEAMASRQPGGGSSAPAPISAHGGAAADGQPAAGAPAGLIDFDLPKSWEKQTPSSSMRIAQAAIPGPGGPGDFAVFSFGPGGGGSVDANIERWVGQVETSDHPKPETFEAGGLKVTWVDVKGTLKASQMGPGPSASMSDARLYGAVVEGPGGPWFFKATGPDKTLGPQRDAFVAMLKSVRSKAASA